MSKKSKKLKKELRERGEKMSSFEDLKKSFETCAPHHIVKEKELKRGEGNNFSKQNSRLKLKNEIEINIIKVNPERPNTFTLKANVTAKGIPAVVEYANEHGCRFATLANGTFKKAIWTPKNRKPSNGVQALIPVTPTNIIVDYNVDKGLLDIFKINKIDESKRIIYMFLYNEFDFTTNKWIKPVFDSLAFIPSCAKEKVETRSTCFKANSYKKETDVENTEPEE